MYCFGEHESILSVEEALEDEYLSADEDLLNDSGVGIDLELKVHQTGFKKVICRSGDF